MRGISNWQYSASQPRLTDALKQVLVSQDMRRLAQGKPPTVDDRMIQRDASS